MTAPRAPANRAEVVEVMASAALWQPWAKFDPDEQDRLRFIARAVLAALEAAGVRLVPAEAIDAAKTLIDDLDGLVGESEGVFGMHANGDPAPWGDLLPGGQFERLSSLDDARALFAASPYAPEGGR